MQLKDTHCCPPASAWSCPTCGLPPGPNRGPAETQLSKHSTLSTPHVDKTALFVIVCRLVFFIKPCFHVLPLIHTKHAGRTLASSCSAVPVVLPPATPFAAFICTLWRRSPVECWVDYERLCGLLTCKSSNPTNTINLPGGGTEALGGGAP